MATKKKGGRKNVAPSSMRRKTGVPADRSSSVGRKTAAAMIEPAKGKLGVMVALKQFAADWPSRSVRSHRWARSGWASGPITIRR
jgi:acetylornithine/succinyldiaminopimelate/putrescine aminotransferase